MSAQVDAEQVTEKGFQVGALGGGQADVTIHARHGAGLRYSLDRNKGAPLSTTFKRHLEEAGCAKQAAKY